MFTTQNTPNAFEHGGSAFSIAFDGREVTIDQICGFSSTEDLCRACDTASEPLESLLGEQSVGLDIQVRNEGRVYVMLEVVHLAVCYASDTFYYCCDHRGGEMGKGFNVGELGVDIVRPGGDADSKKNDGKAYWLKLPCRHWDFQGVSNASAEPYGLHENVYEGDETGKGVEGRISEEGYGYEWSTQKDVGTLSGNSKHPVHAPPATAPVPVVQGNTVKDDRTQGEFKLVAKDGDQATACATTRKVLVYVDHLARDHHNFGSGTTCASGTWKTPFGDVEETTWNCYGSAWHHYIGGASVWARSMDGPFLAWEKRVVEGQVRLNPFLPTVQRALEQMKRGDVVCFYDDNGYLQHAHTSLSGSLCYGANNEPTRKPQDQPTPSELWKWHECTSLEYATAARDNWNGGVTFTPGNGKAGIEICIRPAN